MRLFLHPPGPLSQIGRVLWCAAIAVFAAALSLVWSSPARADDSEARKAESPYFHVNSSEPGTDRLPLKSTTVDVRIAGVIADVTVVQRYRNEGQRPIEARYVFPGSTQSAVYAMNVRLDRALSFVAVALDHGHVGDHAGDAHVHGRRLQRQPVGAGLAAVDVEVRALGLAGLRVVRPRGRGPDQRQRGGEHRDRRAPQHPPDLAERAGWVKEQAHDISP